MSEQEEIFGELVRRGQGQLFRFWEELDKRQRQNLLEQIRNVDWDVFGRERYTPPGGEISPVDGLLLPEIAREREKYFRAGAEALRAGKLAAVLLAGGQGTRLGCDLPKGAYDIGVTRPLYIFECLINNLREVCLQCGTYVPLYIMTSGKNDGATQAFLRRHDYFGYPADKVFFFLQDMAPCTDLTGKILLEAKDRIAVSPNGNGGWYSSLRRSGLLENGAETEWFNVFAVDNVLQRIADPVFLGATILSGADCGAKFVRKAAPNERVGVLCTRGGLPDVVEYYELPEQMTRERNADGTLVYSFGVTLNYLFRASALNRAAREFIPVHMVKKKVACLDEAGRLSEPTEENAYKYETLVVDMVRFVGNCLPFEVEREREFAPVKNKTGTDSVDTARELLRKNGVVL